jgi:small multidrug resistance family-3 protein
MFLLVFIVTAIAEIAGCFGFWAWLRLGKSSLWAIPGIASLLLFGYLTTKLDAPLAGRAYAAYGGIYVATSIFWLWLVEGVGPDRWDLAGALICVAGTLVILFGRRAFA